MRSLVLPGTLWMMTLVLFGCGGESVPYTDHSRDPEAYARDIKMITLQVVHDARTSSEPAEALDTLISELEDSGSRPVGSYQATYAQILSLAKEARDSVAATNKPSAGFSALLNQLEQSVKDLPGKASSPRE